MTLLESAFPYRAVSMLAQADKRGRDPIYGAHAWWARRPPSLLRAILLAACCDAADDSEFWDLYRSTSSDQLTGRRVLDIFHGGGSTLVEAARLGADVIGVDVDPLANEIVAHELESCDPAQLRSVADELLQHLASELGGLYPPSPDDRTPIHYFYAPRVACPSCGDEHLLYRDLVLARDRGLAGGVVRDAKLHVFCPEDRSVHALNRADRVRLRHLGHQWDVSQGTFKGLHFECPSCGVRSGHTALRTGAAESVLIAVESAQDGHRRTISAPSAATLRAIAEAASLADRANVPRAAVSARRGDGRPGSYGLPTVDSLFRPRQLLYLSAALGWIDSQGLDPALRRGLRLAVSNSIATNNRLCGYARDYGRLSPLFSIRGYAFPALSVELNPLSSVGGRGTLTACLDRVVRSCQGNAPRPYWSLSERRVVRRTMASRPAASSVTLHCQSADDALPDSVSEVDCCVFDPPYFDYINYEGLSQLHRAWLSMDPLPGEALHPAGDSPAESITTFGLRLGNAIRAAVRTIKHGGVTAFTYHSTNPDAWEALALALDQAKVRVTALWPVRSDGHMGHHSHAGNCEWDAVIVIRPVSETTPAECRVRLDDWVRELKPLRLSGADRENLSMAIGVASERFGLHRKR